MMRSAIRQVWMHHPVKLLKLELAKTPDFNKGTRTKWLYLCEICDHKFKLADVEVDHIEGHHSMTTEALIVEYYNSILNVTVDDLQVVCKPCHAIKTHVERNPGMTWDEAVIDKKVIAAMANPAARQKAYLARKGFPEERLKNKEQRGECYRELYGNTTNK